MRASPCAPCAPVRSPFLCVHGERLSDVVPCVRGRAALTHHHAEERGNATLPNK